jgi:hypothetical protein
MPFDLSSLFTNLQSLFEGIFGFITQLLQGLFGGGAAL